jgi:NADH-quinone oxidoreductase subunit M
MNFPILSSITLLPALGALFILFSKNENRNVINLSLFISIVNLLLAIFLWYSFDKSFIGFQFIEEQNWINGFIKFKFGIDGISILFIILTAFITPICIISCINSVKTRLKEFLIAILILETFMIGVFCSLDLVVFYIFFEAGLIPMFLIIGIWGGPKRVYAAFKFFLFTLLGSVLMLVAIISIYWITGTTDITQIFEIKIPVKYQYVLWLAFFSSFAVKMPMWPVHTWLPDAHVEAPTAGSVILAAILLKMAGYGFLRFSIGMFPVASEYFVPLIYALSIIAIIYTSLVALMQEDMKKLIAYSSVAHMGFVTLGIFTFTLQGIEGSIFQMISHGLISAALFLCVGVLYDRVHSRLISSYGGIVNVLPKYSLVFAVFMLGALGLPGTSGFVGEILILIGAFQKSFLVAVLASIGIILGAAYMLWLYKRVVFGKLEKNELKELKDLNLSEGIVLFSLVALVLFVGFYPNLILDTVHISVEELIKNYEQAIIFNLNMIK